MLISTAHTAEPAHHKAFLVICEAISLPRQRFLASLKPSVSFSVAKPREMILPRNQSEKYHYRLGALQGFIAKLQLRPWTMIEF